MFSYSATAYSIRTVSETLSHLIKQALSYYPQHIPWIRLNGELEFGNLFIFITIVDVK